MIIRSSLELNNCLRCGNRKSYTTLTMSVNIPPSIFLIPMSEMPIISALLFVKIDPSRQLVAKVKGDEVRPFTPSASRAEPLAANDSQEGLQSAAAPESG